MHIVKKEIFDAVVAEYGDTDHILSRTLPEEYDNTAVWKDTQGEICAIAVWTQAPPEHEGKPYSTYTTYYVRGYLLRNLSEKNVNEAEKALREMGEIE